jgi:hypothetical protein
MSQQPPLYNDRFPLQANFYSIGICNLLHRRITGVSHHCPQKILALMSWPYFGLQHLLYLGKSSYALIAVTRFCISSGAVAIYVSVNSGHSLSELIYCVVVTFNFKIIVVPQYATNAVNQYGLFCYKPPANL